MEAKSDSIDGEGQGGSGRSPHVRAGGDGDGGGKRFDITMTNATDHKIWKSLRNIACLSQDRTRYEDTCDLIIRLFFIFFRFVFGGFAWCKHRKWTLWVVCIRVCVCLIGGTDTRFPTGKDIKFPLTRRLLSSLRPGPVCMIIIIITNRNGHYTWYRIYMCVVQTNIIGTVLWKMH